MRDWVAAGLAGAVLSGVPSMAHALVTRASFLDSRAAIAETALPAEWPRAVLIGAGGAAHVAISLGWAGVIRRVLGPRPSVPGAVAAGLGIAALDLGVIGRRLPSIRRLPPVPQVFDHVAYGMVVALSLRGRGGGTG